MKLALNVVISPILLLGLGCAASAQSDVGGSIHHLQKNADGTYGFANPKTLKGPLASPASASGVARAEVAAVKEIIFDPPLDRPTPVKMVRSIPISGEYLKEAVSTDRGISVRVALAMAAARNGMLDLLPPPIYLGSSRPSLQHSVVHPVGAAGLNANTLEQQQYRGTSGATYRYDLSNPGDAVRYQVDPAAQLRDSIDPRVGIDRSLGQYGGGVAP